jgi:ABC-2 type transport system ATP-binding protein
MYSMEQIELLRDVEPCAIHIDGLSKVYQGKIRALDNVSLDIGVGMFGLLGPNGAGKTTLIRILATLIKPTTGLATVNGLNVANGREKWAVKRLLGYLPQELSLYMGLSVIEFLDYMATLKEVSPKGEKASAIHRVLNMVGMEEHANQMIRTLSGGMKRRVGIAQALLGEPRLLIVDEPTAGLDPEERVRFRTLLASLAGQRMVLLSTHIVEDIATTCNDMAVFRKGHLLFHGSPDALIHAAVGRVWELIMKPKDTPDPAWRVVTSIRDSERLKLRIVGERPDANAEAVSPTLEEAYLSFMAADAGEHALAVM